VSWPDVFRRGRLRGGAGAVCEILERPQRRRCPFFTSGGGPRRSSFPFRRGAGRSGSTPPKRAGTARESRLPDQFGFGGEVRLTMWPASPDPCMSA
jgi:hypothetical protein